ncbi:MAG: hypothetical protein LBB84_01860 [Tannerellaceae bacterium]|jgi:hypothetical protein|nr:hypothetical protein [Tannerellaceae bacterium]
MRKQIAFISILSVALILLGGCRKSLKDFSFYYTIESVNNYKLALTLGSDKTYKIEQYNYFMDNHANRQAPIITEGAITDREYDEVVKHLSACNFFRMKDTYGFDKESTEDATANILYQITFRTGGKEKYISIRNSDSNLFPEPFIHLLKYTSNFLSAHSPAKGQEQ